MEEKNIVPEAQKKVVFISGPIDDVDRYWEAFEAAEDELTAAGIIPLSPSRLPSGLSREQVADICMGMVRAADAVLVLTSFFKDGRSAYEVGYCQHVGKPYSWSVDFLKEVLKV